MEDKELLRQSMKLAGIGTAKQLSIIVGKSPHTASSYACGRLAIPDSVFKAIMLHMVMSSMRQEEIERKAREK